MRKRIRIQERALYRWVRPFFDPLQSIRAFPRYICFLRDLTKYSKLNGAERIEIGNTYPCIHDKTQTTGFEAHYFYQDIWAFKKIYESKVDHHVDVGSRVDFVGFLTVITKVAFIDIRPLRAKLKNLDSRKGDVLFMPFENNSIFSLSCLHVAEHIGLGRYGDPLDPLGTKKACQELCRVLAIGGNLYFSLPVGKPRLCFNAHRIHSPQQIIEYFSDLELVELSGVDDEGNFIKKIDIAILENSDYGCGLFHFTKKQEHSTRP
jgi:SAM-dependent methyltransferase